MQFTGVVSSLLCIVLTSCVQCYPQPPCDYTKGTQPIEILNSKYAILENDQFCCPETASKSKCTPEAIMNEICEHGLVLEPCYHCLTCAKTLGDSCGGRNGLVGRCSNQWDCTVDKELFLDGGNATGVCAGKKTQKQHEVCGGPFGVKGRCSGDLVCSANEDEFLSGKNISGVCLKKVCFKDCSIRTMAEVCGSNGRFYDNICFLRQENCLNPPDVPVTKEDDMTKCNKDTNEPTAVTTDVTKETPSYSGQPAVMDEELNNRAS